MKIELSTDEFAMLRRWHNLFCVFVLMSPNSMSEAEKALLPEMGKKLGFDQHLDTVARSVGPQS